MLFLFFFDHVGQQFDHLIVIAVMSIWLRQLDDVLEGSLEYG